MLIDLDAAPPAPDRPRRNPRYGLIVAVALLLVLGGAAAPPVAAAGLVEVASSTGDIVRDLVLTEDALYTAGPGAAGRAGVRATPLHPGGPRWSAEVTGGEVSLTEVGGVLMVRADPVVFLDAATGALRWKAPDGALVQRLGDDRVAIAVDERLRVAELATGRTIWSRPAADVFGLDAGPGRLVAFNYPAALVSVYDAGTGAVLVDAASIEVGADLFGSAYPAPFAEARVVGERLFVYGTSRILAFRLADLRRLGVADVSLPVFGAQDCGDLVCTTGHGGVAVYTAGLDRRLWSTRGWLRVGPDGIAVAADGRAARIDLATGDVLTELGRGGPVGDLMLHLEADRAWVTELAGGRVLGRIPPVVPLRCVTTGGYLACPTNGSTVTVWRRP